MDYRHMETDYTIHIKLGHRSKFSRDEKGFSIHYLSGEKLALKNAFRTIFL